MNKNKKIIGVFTLGGKKDNQSQEYFNWLYQAGVNMYITDFPVKTEYMLKNSHADSVRLLKEQEGLKKIETGDNQENQQGVEDFLGDDGEEDQGDGNDEDDEMD